MENRKDIHMDLSSIESINNLDTARMSLRWALERLHALEKAKEELTALADKETAAREKTESEYKALRRSFDMRVEEDEQRERYYAKMEEFTALQSQGKLDIASLARREAEAARLEASLKERRIHLEQEHSAKREHLANEQPRLKAEIVREAQARVAKLEENLATRRELLESEYSAKNDDLSSREKWFRQQERALEERQKNFDIFSAEQTESFTRDMKNFQNALEEQTQTRLLNTERLLDQRYAAKEAAWDKERALLLKDLIDWRRKAEERQPRIQELEKRVSEAEEKVCWASGAPAREAELRKQMEERAASRQRQLSDSHQREQELERRLLELQDIKNQLSAAEAAARGALAAAATDAERRNKTVQEKTQAFLDKKHALEKKLAELGAQRDHLETKSAEQAARLEDLEKRGSRSEAAVKEKEQALLKLEREIEWENANLRGALASWEDKYLSQVEHARELDKELSQFKENSETALQTSLQRGDEIQRLQQQLAGRNSRIQELENKISDAEEASRGAIEAAALKSHASENTSQLLKQSKQEFLKREQFLERQLAMGQEELSRKERSLQDQIARAEEAAAQGFHASENIGQLMEQNKQSFLKREQLLERQLAALRDELSLKDKKLQDQAAAIEEIQKCLTQAQEEARQAGVQAQAQTPVQISNPQETARIAELEKLLARESERRKKLEAFLADRLGGSPPSAA